MRCSGPQERDTSLRKTPKPQNGRPSDESGPMGNFGSQRPSLLQTRQSRASGGMHEHLLPPTLTAEHTPEDIILGPPKTSFASSRNIRRSEEGEERSGTGNAEADDYSLEGMSARTRNFNDDDSGRRRGFGVEDKDKDGWVTARKNRGYENRPADKEKTFGRGLRERGDRQATGGDESGRRNGFNSRDEARWPRDGDEKKPYRAVGRETGGWRDRERRPEREFGREAPAEKEPEWMDEPYVDEGPVARTAAEFEQWKARMKGHRAEEPKDQASPAPEQSPEPPKLSTSIFADSTFGTWGDAKKHDTPGRQEQTPVTPGASKKASRFASMFAPKEEPRPPMPEPVPEQSVAAAAATANPDQEAFQRMLFKLRATSVGSPSETLASTNKPAAQGASPGLLQPSGGAIDHRASPNALISMLANKSDSRPSSTPDLFLTGDHSQGAQNTVPSHTRQQSQTHAPPRDVPPPQAPSLHAILGSQQQSERKTPTLSKDSEFLLNLIQMKSANRPPSQKPQQESDPNFQLFLDQPPRPQAQGPPPQSRTQPPSGVMQQIPIENPYRSNSELPPPDRRQATTQPPPGFFDGPPPTQQSRRPPGFGPQMPPPPEFFQHDPCHPPPGFMGGMHHGPPQHPGAHGPPPNMQGLPGMFSSPPPPPPHMLHQQQHLQHPQQRGPPGLSSGDHVFGPGPGIGPPPGFPQGFMPPPGFGGPPPPFPPGMGRARMEMPSSGMGMGQGQGQDGRSNGVGRGR
ncbi:hypothetical protein ANO11243_082070 [Dothideomycetidae sp. 11243]|nr:hypothetical protein ANO11243_082070 [fungal sp. No.11243]